MVYATAPVTVPTSICLEPSWNVTVMVNRYVAPSAQPVVSVPVPAAVPPGGTGIGLKDIAGVHVWPGAHVSVIPVIGTSPVFLIVIAAVPSSPVTTSLALSIIAAGLLPADVARLKKTPVITIAAATVIAMSNSIATKGLKPRLLLPAKTFTSTLIIDKYCI